jgi:hypothetical protein
MQKHHDLHSEFPQHNDRIHELNEREAYFFRVYAVRACDVFRSNNFTYFWDNIYMIH